MFVFKMPIIAISIFLTAPPDVTIACDGHEMDVCFTSTDYSLDSDFLYVTPGCVKATGSDVTNGVCMNIDIEECQASLSSVSVMFDSLNYSRK